MDKYTDLKFEGDLAFLNEHLEQARIASNDALNQNSSSASVNDNNSNDSVNDNDKEKNVDNLKRSAPINSYFENNGIFSYNLTSGGIGNVPSKWNFKNQIADVYTDSKDTFSNNDFEHEEKIENGNSVQSTSTVHNTDDSNSSIDDNYTSQIQHLQETDLLEDQSNDDVNNALIFHEQTFNKFNDSETNDDQAGFDNSENLENDKSFHNETGVRNNDEYSTFDDDRFATQFEQSEKISSLDSKNTSDVHIRKNFLETILCEFNDSEIIDDDNDAIFGQLENKENVNSFQSQVSILNNDQDVINYLEPYAKELDQIEKSDLLDSQNTDDARNPVGFPQIDLNEFDASNSIDDDAIFEQSENIENFNSFQSEASILNNDKANIIDVEHYTKKLEQAAHSDLLDSQNTNDVHNRVSFHEIDLNEFSDSDSIEDDAIFKQSENIENVNRFQSEASILNNGKDNIIDVEHYTKELEQVEHSDLLDSQNTDDARNPLGFPEIDLNEFSDFDSIDDDAFFEQPESIEIDDSLQNTINFQGNDEFYNSNNMDNITQLDQSDKMENVKNSHNNESFINSRDFQNLNPTTVNSSEINQNNDAFAQQERLKNDVDFQNARNLKNLDEFNNANKLNYGRQFDHSEKTGNLRDAPNNENFPNSIDFQNTNPSAVNNAEINQNSAAFSQQERLKNDINFQNARNFKNVNELSNANNWQYRTQFDQSEKAENLRDTPNDQSFQNSRYFQDGKQGKFNDVENSQNVDDFSHQEKLKNNINFQNTRNFRNVDDFNKTNDLLYRNQFDQSEKTENLRATQNNESFQNLRDFQNPNQSKFTGSENSQNSDVFSQQERLRNNINFQSTRNFRNVDDFNNNNDHRYRSQFGQSEKNSSLRNTLNDESFQNSRNFQDPRASRYNASVGNQNNGNLTQPERLRNETNYQDARNYKNNDDFNRVNNLQYRTQFEQSEKLENLRSSQNNENFQNRGNVHNANDNQKMQNIIDNNSDKFYNWNSRNYRQYDQNHSDIENTANARFIHNDNMNQNFDNNHYSAGGYKNGQAEINQALSDRVSPKKIIDVNTYTVNEFEVVQPANIIRKSQLELMLLSSGFDMELFNNFKEELLELEKDNIIMKYKQDLMMTILKS
jgi:hypothetical protein